MDAIVEQLRLRFPASEFTPLGGGGTNAVIRMKQKDLESVVKVAMISNTNAEVEALCLHFLNDTGLSPRLISSFQIENRTALQMEYAEGKTVLESIFALQKEAKFHDIPPLFVSMGKLLAKLHSLPINKELKRISLSIPQGKNFIHQELYRRSLNCISSLNERAPVLLHGDFGYHNIIAGPEGKMTLIDWELAGIGDPKIDIANLLFWTHLHFPDMAQDCVRAFLHTYSEERNAEFTPSELKATVIFQVWRILDMVNESFPANVLTEWNRRLSWALDHEFV